jgi:hypothetical protein
MSKLLASHAAPTVNSTTSTLPTIVSNKALDDKTKRLQEGNSASGVSRLAGLIGAGDTDDSDMYSDGENYYIYVNC